MRPGQRVRAERATHPAGIRVRSRLVREDSARRPDPRSNTTTGGTPQLGKVRPITKGRTVGCLVATEADRDGRSRQSKLRQGRKGQNGDRCAWEPEGPPLPRQSGSCPQQSHHASEQRRPLKSALLSFASPRALLGPGGDANASGFDPRFCSLCGGPNPNVWLLVLTGHPQN